MSASFFRRATLIASVVSVLSFTGCSPEALDLGQVTPPQPELDPSVTTSFDFETMPPVVDDSFTIGEAPLTAKFTGGDVTEPEDPQLTRSPSQAWLIGEGNSASIEFEPPASGFEFFHRNEFEVEQCDPPQSLGLDLGDAFGGELFARGGFSGWANPPVAPYNFVNQGGGVYQARFPMTAGAVEFKLAIADWSTQYSDPVNGPTVGETWQVTPGDNDNTTIEIPADGCYTWTVKIIDDTAVPAPEIEVLIEEFDPDSVVSCEVPNFDFIASEAFGSEIFIRGVFNDWGNSGLGPPYGFINQGRDDQGRGVYQTSFDISASPGQNFKIAAEDWAGTQYADPDNPTVLGVPQVISEGDTGPDANSTISIGATGTFLWTLTVLDESEVPAPSVELLVQPCVPAVSGGGGQVRVYDVLDNLIATFNSQAQFLKVEMARSDEDGDTLISRIEIDNIAPENPEDSVGYVAIDDFEFTSAPQIDERQVVLVYTRPGGDYGNTIFDVTGDIVGGARQLTCQIREDGDGLVCIAIVEVLPGGTITYTVLNDGVPDDAGPIDLNYNAIASEFVFNFSGSNVPLTTELPVFPQENEVILFYKRDDNEYEGWGLHLFPISSPDWTKFTDGEYPYAGIDPVLGAYFIIALPGSDRLTAPYSLEPDPLPTFPESLGFLVHKGDEKDPNQDLFIRRDFGQFIFVRAGANLISTTPPVGDGVTVTDAAAAHWVTQDTLLWSAGDDVDSVELHFSADASIRGAGGLLVAADMTFPLDAGVSPTLPNSTHLEELDPYTLPAEALDMIDVLVTGQLLAIGLDSSGKQVKATGVQIPLVLDNLYAEAAAGEVLGVTYDGGVPSLSVWAPTSQMVSVNIYDAADAETPSNTVPMEYDDTTGIWSVTGTMDWDRKYYTYAVTNFVPVQSLVREQVVTDPYSVNISMGDYPEPDIERERRLVKSQMLNLDDADLKPAGWDSLVKPPLDAPEDIVLYELHVRDFSALDTSVMADDRGKYTAFASDGSGAMHLADMAAAGLTHVHILPAFDIASVSEDPAQRVDLDDTIADLCAVNTDPDAEPFPFCDMHSGTILEALQSYGPGDTGQQDIVAALQDHDSFNWGYDPVHFNVPEGSYSSDPDTEARVLEFRAMVQGLSDLGLRSVLDQVYNHTNASGTNTNSVLDKVVPGYYHRRDATTGRILSESCCDDTAAEHAMMDKFIVDSMVHWTKAYKIDGFRLDLMSFHPVATMERARDALQALTLEGDGIDGSTTYIYGEGWNTGTPANNGRFVNAWQDNLAGTGIGSFNDRMRDAVRGGGPGDRGATHIDTQGFISGQFYDPNINNPEPTVDGLLEAADRIRVSMAGGLSGFPLIDRNGNSTTGGAAGGGYVDDPQEVVNYIAAHDDETLWDIAQYKHPVATSTADRVRAQILGNSILLLGQGVPFMHAGQELLRSKSMDRNTFNSGDWFNRLDFSGDDNNFAVGEPLAGENGDSLAEIAGVLAIGAADPGSADILFASDVTKEFLQIRKDTQLFRLRTAADIANRVQYHNTGPDQVPGMIVMSLDGCNTDEYMPEYGGVVVVVNASVDAQVFDLYGDRTFNLHPVQVSSVDAVVAGAFHDTDGYHVPARTTAVFVEARDGETLCGFGTDFAESTAFVTGDFNGNAFANAMIQVADTSIIETTVTLPVGADQRYRIQSNDSASINCGGPVDGGPLFTPESNGGTMATILTCASNPDELSLDSSLEARYKFSLDKTNVLNPSLVFRAQAGTGFPIGGGGCGVADAGNDNDAFFNTDVFVRGSFNDWGAPPDFQLINTGNSEFQLESVFDSGDWQFKVAGADWSPEYGDPDNPVVLGVTQTVPRASGEGTDLQLALAEDGCYNFTVVPSVELDTDDAPLTIDLTVTLIPQDTGEPTATPLVRGGFNDWGLDDAMTQIDLTTFEAVVSVAADGDYLFKVASEDWELGIVNCGGPHVDLGTGVVDATVGGATTISCGQNPANLRASFSEAGDYTFRLDTSNRNNPTLTIASFLGAGFNQDGFGMPSVYLKGDFNMFGLDNVTTAAGGGRLYFTTVNLTADTYAFRFESEDGVTISCGTPTGGTADVTPDVATTIACGQNLDDLTVTIPADGDYQFRIDAGLTGTAAAPILTVSSPP